MASAYRWRQLRLAPLALSGVLGRSVSQSEPCLGKIPFPPLDQRLMRAILLLRGVYDSNDLGRKTMARCAQRLLERLQREVSPRDADPLPSVQWSECDPAHFYDRFVKHQQPVVIKGAPTKTSHWSIDWLVANHGDQEASLMDTDGGIFDGGKIRDLLETAPNGGPFYIHNHSAFFQESPEYRADLCQAQFAALLRRNAPIAAGIFASIRSGTRSFMHCANNLNTFTLLEGRKRWTLVDPNYFLLVYPFLSHTNNFQLALVTGDDKDDLPLYRYCPRYTVELEPGDCLMIPPFWYHGIENLCARTLAVAVRWMPHQRGEDLTNTLFRFLDGAANRDEPGNKGAHQDSSELVGTGAARSSWGLPA
jgi:hypothetical protein